MNVYEKITDKIIEQLEAGVVPWQKPWRVTTPKNYLSKQPYRGINLLMLGFSEYDCEYWATFRQIKNAGGSVKKGQRGTLVVYTNWFEVEDDISENKKKVPFLKQYTVFNLEQTEGIKIPATENTTLDKLQNCETIWQPMPTKPNITNDGGNRALYRPTTDSIHLPPWSRFKTAEEYYSTLFHELIHSTGHKTRLARPGIMETDHFGSKQYSQEELIAEIGNAFLCGMTGIEKHTLENSTAYIAGWLKELKNDKRLIVIAAAQAQKATDYITSR
jgi:antirestriction protein ArdC